MYRLEVGKGEDHRADQCGEEKVHSLIECPKNDLPEHDFLQDRPDDGDDDHGKGNIVHDAHDVLRVFRTGLDAEEGLDLDGDGLCEERHEDPDDGPDDGNPGACWGRALELKF